MARIGRPKAENPKSITRTIRLDEQTDRKLQEYCEKRHIPRTVAIREGILLLLAQEK